MIIVSKFYRFVFVVLVNLLLLVIIKSFVGVKVESCYYFIICE